MSKYTTEVRFICESYAGLDESKGYNSVNSIIDTARTQIFDFNYPIFDEAYRPILERKILKHYYTREICEETVGLWKLRLDAKMNEIMPYFNKLYNSELIEFNPLYEVDYNRQGEKNDTNKQTGTNNNTRNSTDSGSDVLTNNLTNKNVQSGTDTRTNNLTYTSNDGGTESRSGSSRKGGSDTTSNQARDKYEEWNLYSDTPQGGIEGIVGAENEPSVVDDGYLTNARHVLHDGNGTTSSSTTNYGGTDTTNDSTTFGKTNTSSNTGTVADQYGKTDTETKTGTATTQFGKKNITTDNGGNSLQAESTEEYLEHVYGRMSGTSPSKLIMEYRETFLNIDMMVIDALKNLFFNLW